MLFIKEHGIACVLIAMFFYLPFFKLNSENFILNSVYIIVVAFIFLSFIFGFLSIDSGIIPKDSLSPNKRLWLNILVNVTIFVVLAYITLSVCAYFNALPDLPESKLY